MSFTIHPVILCGGSGTRLWPLSTPHTPKQFLTLTSSKSLIEDTAARFKTTERSDTIFAPLLVVGAKRHEELLKEKLPNADMILEPMGRNSAPAVAAASLARTPDDLILILPADHDIRDVPAFHDAIAIAAEAATTGAIVTFGIEPTHPATGYGYIKAADSDTRICGALDVQAFVEKPDLNTAQSYLDTGGYYWNAGIFLFKASIMLDSLMRYAPEVVSGTRAAMSQARDGTIDLHTDAFAEVPSISIDYAVMEKAANVMTVPVSMGWSDVGGYRALHELLTEKDTDNYKKGPVHIQNSNGVYARSEGPAVSVNGVSNLVIVATENEVVISPKDDDGVIKELGKIVQTDRHVLGVSPTLREKARDWLWTTFDTWAQNAWDPERGGFAERLDMDGAPDFDADRRVRVQARQVFSFSKAIELGYPESKAACTLVGQGLDYIYAKLRNPEGGWMHVVDAFGERVDGRRDLYDHAFLVLAGATAHRATGHPLALKIADEAIEFIDSEMKDHDHGGWFESIPTALPRRANPHMHLLEAMICYHQSTGARAALERAGEIVRLFEAKFFNPVNDVMGEFFNEDWSRPRLEHEVVFEPGHHYEWASLLHAFDEITRHDSLSWRRRLIKTADRYGRNPETGCAYNLLDSTGNVLSSNSRLWHQLEQLRCSVLHPGATTSDDPDTIATRIFELYLDKGPIGGWYDEIDANGECTSSHVPASMLYHCVTALELIL